jgi:hypothetical protein
MVHPKDDSLSGRVKDLSGLSLGANSMSTVAVILTNTASKSDRDPVDKAAAVQTSSKCWQTMCLGKEALLQTASRTTLAAVSNMSALEALPKIAKLFEETPSRGEPL